MHISRSASPSSSYRSVEAIMLKEWGKVQKLCPWKLQTPDYMYELHLSAKIPRGSILSTPLDSWLRVQVMSCGIVSDTNQGWFHF